MNNAPRNLCYVATVSASQSSAAFSRSSGFGSIWETGWDEPTGKLQGVKKLKKIIGNKKGIDTILAALLMVVIVVVASVMVYAWSTGLLGTLLVTPQTGKEAMNIENSAFNSVYNVTLDLRNTGSSSITLNSYYVKDSSGNQWSRLTWQTDAGGQHPAAIAPNALGIVYVSIGNGATGSGGQCGSSCTQTGSFTQFSTGFSYTIVVVTSRNNQFSFTVTK